MTGRSASQVFLDDLLGGHGGQALTSKEPLWAVLKTSKNDEEKLLQAMLGLVQDYTYSRMTQFWRMRQNLFLYSGKHFKEQLAEGGEGKLSQYRVIANKTKILVDDRVNRLTKIKPDISVLGQPGDFDDRVNAELIQLHLATVASDLRFESKFEEFLTWLEVFGEMYLEVGWDADAGEVDEESERAKVEIGDEVVSLEKEMRKGEVRVRLRLPWEVYLDINAATREECNWVGFRDLCPVSDVRVDYGDNEIEENLDVSRFSIEDMSQERLGNHVALYRFYHRRTPKLPEGCELIFTPQKILKVGPIPYKRVVRSEFGELPVEQMVAIKTPNSIFGKSRVTEIATLQAQLNNAFALWGRNLFTVLHPKWMVMEGSLKNPQSLTNKPMVVEYKRGSQPPQLITPQSPAIDIAQFMDVVEKKMDAIFNSHPISRGEVAKNIRSAEQMQILEAEQEESEGMMVAGYVRFLLSLNRKVLGIISEYYDPADKRYIRALGDDHQWKIEEFDVSKLDRPWELELQVSSDLPKNKAAKMRALMQMRQMFPNVVTEQKFAQLLRLGALEEFFDAAVLAYECAEREDFKMMRGGGYPEPREWEDFISHWMCHTKTLQSAGFMDWPEERAEMVINHVMATEMLMYKKGLKSPLFRQELLQLQGFPYVFTPPRDSVMGPQVAGLGQVPSASPVDQQKRNGSGGPGLNFPEVNQGRALNGQFGQKLGG